MTRPGRRRHRRQAIAGTIVGLLIAGAIIGFSRLSVESYKPRIEAALSNATGRQVLIHGRIGLGLSLHPTIAANDVSIANPPGFSRPDMARIGALDVRLALLPLLHHEISIDSLTLEKPDILLERTAQGQENWRLTPASAQPPGAPSSAPAVPTRPYALSLSQLQIEDGRVAYRDGGTGHLTAVDVSRLNLSASGPDAPMKLDAAVVVNGLDVKATGETGSLAALRNQAASKPWPVSLTLTAAGAKLTAQGILARPLEGQGYDIRLNAAVPDLAALRPLAPNAKLPALHDVALAAHVADTGGPIPVISAITLRSGAGDLAPLLPGLTIKQASLSAPALDQAVKADLSGSLADFAA